MILQEHVASHDRMKMCCEDPMVMLGNQENKIGYSFGVAYRTLDPDGGDLSWDLNNPVPSEWHGLCGTVYNLGVIEHVWNAHEAFCNAARMIRNGGYYLHHGPCAGYENHGIHVTDYQMILKFFMANGFTVVGYWFTKQSGVLCESPVRGCKADVIFWMIAKKNWTVPEFTAPQQFFKDGVPV